MVDLDVLAPHAHLECSKQTHYFHQLGMGLFVQRHFTEVDLEAEEK